MVPTFDEWLTLSDHDRQQIIDRWNPYAGEGGELVAQIVADFRNKHGSLRGLTVNGMGVYHGGQWVIDVSHPFIFDRRTLPASHLAIMVHGRLIGELPIEFSGSAPHEYIWAPPRFEAFVDRCADDIARELQLPSASREEFLSALVGMPFADWVDQYHTWVRDGSIKPSK